MNSLSTLFASIIAVIIFTLVPTYRTYWIIDQHVFKYVNMEVQEFADNVRHKGYIDTKMYDDFVMRLANTQNVYDISMVHTKKVYYPLQISDPGYSADHTFEVVEEQYPMNTIIKTIGADAAHQYRMSVGDSISVVVVNRSKTGTMVFLQVLGGDADTSLIFSRAGGMITNEDY